MAELCRARQNAVAPNPRPGMWMFAVLFIILLAVASSLIAAAVMFSQTLPRSNAESFPPPVAYELTMVVAPETRKVFPYSIVPGGAQNLDEAKRAMNDPAVKANYAGIDFRKLRQVRLARNLSGYVSYRRGEKIYWTSEMLTLRAGETVFTDGVYLVRGRCLNGYSPGAMLPIRPDEPTEQVLDTPVEMPVIAYSIPRLTVAAPELPPSPGSLTPAVPVLPPSKPGAGIWFPLVPIIPPLHRGSP
jgi:hypothetical protein